MAAATAPGLRCAREQCNAGVAGHGSVVAALSVPRLVEIDQLYVALSERGYKIDQSKAKDAAKTAAMANAFYPVTDY